MVWIVDEKSPALPDIQIGSDACHISDVVEWARHLTDIEINSLHACGMRALPLKVQSCGLAHMLSGNEGARNMQKHLFNRVCLATAFDFSKAASMQVAVQRHEFQAQDGQMYYCNMCLMRVNRSPPTASAAKAGQQVPLVEGQELMLSFPFIFQDDTNPLSHWVVVNTKNEKHYIVLSNKRNPQGMATGIAPRASHKPAEKTASTVCERGDESSGATSKGAAPVQGKQSDASEFIRKAWKLMPLERRRDLLCVREPFVFEYVLRNLNQQLTKGAAGSSDKSASMRQLVLALPLISAIGFEQRLGKEKVMKVSDSLICDGDRFFALLEQLCPKLFTGRPRRRRTPSECAALLEQPPRDLERLQQKVAQLIEQRLWCMVDDANLQKLVSEAPVKARRRKKAPKESAQNAVSNGPSAGNEQPAKANQEEALGSSEDAVGCNELEPEPEPFGHGSDAIEDDNDEVADLLRECFAFVDVPVYPDVQHSPDCPTTDQEQDIKSSTVAGSDCDSTELEDSNRSDDFSGSPDCSDSEVLDCKVKPVGSPPGLDCSFAPVGPPPGLDCGFTPVGPPPGLEWSIVF